MTDLPHAEEPVLSLLTQLGNAASRSVLRAATTTPQSVGELTDACGQPSSTVYRKVQRLEEMGLLDERVRIRSDGRNVSEYRLCVERISVTVDPTAESGLVWRIDSVDSVPDHADGTTNTDPVWADGGTALDNTATRQTRLEEFARPTTGNTV
jgi:DNA-binding transcriptional ArsR family regulator